MRVLLCGHTGSTNHGCEAIIRSTCLILEQLNIEYICATFDEDADMKNGLDKVVKLVPYPSKSPCVRAVSYAHKKLLHDNIWGNSYYYKHLLDELKPDVVLNVGGDTYCYGIPWMSVALNLEAKKRCIPTVFWGCSVEESVFSQEIMRKDVNLYSYIVSRESLSTKILMDVCKHKNAIFQTCDPAFWLQTVPVELPENFIEGNTLGINLSPVMIGSGECRDSMAYKNVKHLMEHVCKNTDMNICLIPHVYKANPISGDLIILNQLYEEFKHTGRVAIINEDLSCVKLKYAISKCRFFIGARTHSMIAAYSTGVPALALSYSLKSRGLAKDIMGDENKYAISWKELDKEEQLLDVFCNNIVSEENLLRERLSDFMPAYKQSIMMASKRIFENRTKD